MARLSRSLLTTPIEILRTTVTQDDYGSMVESPNAVASQTFCQWLPVSADVAIRGKVEGMNVTAKLYMDIENDIAMTDKVRRGGDSQIYNVSAVMTVPNDHKLMVLIALA